ncbi:MAG: hypothetical protein DHS20C19_24030 [Acidimicrobiales bacterium]|nr:MAG: hypothetical protein DHS20C19_24030 [Acidimicrobiales bacterium]
MRQDTQETLAENHSIFTRRRVKKWHNGIAQLEDDLVDGEVVIAIIDGGPDEYGIGLLMLTQARLLSWRASSGIIDFMLHDIDGVHMDNDAGRDMIIAHHTRMGPWVFKVGEINMLDITPIPRAYVHFATALNELAKQAEEPQPEPTPPATPSHSAADEITKLADLLERGLITADEYEQGKRQALRS